MQQSVERSAKLYWFSHKNKTSCYFYFSENLHHYTKLTPFCAKLGSCVKFHKKTSSKIHFCRSLFFAIQGTAQDFFRMNFEAQLCRFSADSLATLFAPKTFSSFWSYISSSADVCFMTCSAFAGRGKAIFPGKKAIFPGKVCAEIFSAALPWIKYSNQTSPFQSVPAFTVANSLTFLSLHVSFALKKASDHLPKDAEASRRMLFLFKEIVLSRFKNL